jgi:type I restriction enzyme S subunit
MSFTLSEGVDGEKVFLTHWHNITGKRLDPVYSKYQEKASNYKYPVVQLRKLLFKKPQYGANEPGVTRTGKAETRYIRITDIDENGVLKDYLGATCTNIESQYFLNENDVIIARSGNTVGKAYIHKVLPYPCIFAGYMIRFIVDHQQILPAYFFAFTQSNIYKDWVQATQRSAGQPNINAEEYGALEIPLPSRTQQLFIVQKMQKAYTQKQQKGQEAQTILDSIDNYLLKELGIELPEEEESGVEGRMFTRQFSEVNGGRFDPNYFKPKYHSLVKTITNNNALKIGEAITFRNETWDGISFWDDKFPYIEIGEIDIPFGEIRNISFIPKKEAPSRAKMVVHKDDILVPLTRPSRGAIVQYLENENVIASTGFCVIKSVDEDRINKRFLYHLLRSKIVLEQFEQRSSGGNYPAIILEEVKNTLLPLPQKQEQQSIIAKHIDNQYIKAKQLKQEAETILTKAKAEVEQMILRGE